MGPRLRGGDELRIWTIGIIVNPKGSNPHVIALARDGDHRFSKCSAPQLRLIADMLPLWRQVTIACDHAKGACARLAGLPVPTFADSETTLAELKDRVAKTLEFIATVPAEAFKDAEALTITLKAGPRELSFPASDYYHLFAVPNFYFHMSTCYAILRANGVEIGKTDFLGA